MRDTKTPADQARLAPEDLDDLLGFGVGGDIEILGRHAQQQVAHGAADQAGAIAGRVQAFECFQRSTADLLAQDAVLVRFDDA
tara:strand:- start:1082 stop:1330 length:249 start_codon:yes stop_codon:yes gene_type:complete